MAFKFLYPFSLILSGVSLKRKNSNSEEAVAEYPIFFNLSNTFFNMDRGHTAAAGPSEKSAKNKTDFLSSVGSIRQLDGSI